jgi:MFS family permease
MEILLAPLVGALSDSIGRKPVLLLTLFSVLVINAVAACFPVVPLILASTFVSKCVP